MHFFLQSKNEGPALISGNWAAFLALSLLERARQASAGAPDGPI